MNNCSAISLRQQAIFNEMMTVSALY